MSNRDYKFLKVAFVLISVFGFINPSIGLSQFTMDVMMENGPPDKRINIVFLSEGYTASELTDFDPDAWNVLNHLFQHTPPYVEYQSYFNAYKINVISNESGSDRPSQEIYKDTYFNSTYGSHGMEYYYIIIPPTSREKVYSLLQQYMPEYDVAFIVVNDPKSGGSGGEFPIFSAHRKEIAAHEMGHSFAGLDDEYDYGRIGPDVPDIDMWPNTALVQLNGE